MIRRPPRSTQGVSSAASDVYKRQQWDRRSTGTAGKGKRQHLSLIHISEPTRH
ncbi:hypothetical protein [Staphylococcus aureus]